MAETLGEAHDLGWKVRVRCAFGKRDGMKSIRECTRMPTSICPRCSGRAAGTSRWRSWATG